MPLSLNDDLLLCNSAWSAVVPVFAIPAWIVNMLNLFGLLEEH